MEKQLDVPAEITENIFAMDREARAAHGIDNLPGTLEEAIIAMEADPLPAAVLGPHAYGSYLTGKKKEWDEYRTQVTDWEKQKYMVLY